MVDQHAPAAVGEEEGNVLVGLFGARATVAIPDFDALTVADEGGNVEKSRERPRPEKIS